MLKKITTILILVGIGAILIWGGVNRTLARNTENGTAANKSQGTGAGKTDGNRRVGSSQSDCDETQSEKGGKRGQSKQTATGEGNDQYDPGFYGKEGQSSGMKNSQGNDHSVDQAAGESVSQGNSNRNGSSQGNGNGGSQGNGKGSNQGGKATTLAESDIEALQLALDDEYHALAVYTAVIAEFGEVSPFVEIAQSESRHIEALHKQFEKHGLIPPDNLWLGNITAFDSLQAACKAGVQAELANISLYEQLFTMTDDPGLIQVFTNLSRASQEKHLPEFQSCQ